MRSASTAAQKPGGIPKMLEADAAARHDREPVAAGKSDLDLDGARRQPGERAQGNREQHRGGIDMHADVALAERSAIALAHER